MQIVFFSECPKTLVFKHKVYFIHQGNKKCNFILHFLRCLFFNNRYGRFTWILKSSILFFELLYDLALLNYKLWQHWFQVGDDKSNNKSYEMVTDLRI